MLYRKYGKQNGSYLVLHGLGFSLRGGLREIYIYICISDNGRENGN